MATPKNTQAAEDLGAALTQLHEAIPERSTTVWMVLTFVGAVVFVVGVAVFVSFRRSTET